MTKTVTHIDCPKEWEEIDDYSSHRPMLWLAIENTSGLVCEFGSGKGSTPLLHNYLLPKRGLLSYETNEKYLDEKMSQLLIVNYLDVDLGNVGLLFVDSAPGEERKFLVDKHRDNADVIIIHDTEEGAQNIYGIREVLNSFKYRLNYYPLGMPGTTALSNKIDVTKWVDNWDVKTGIEVIASKKIKGNLNTFL